MSLADLARAQAAVRAALARLEADDWGRPTPCDEWDVLAVTRHLVVGDRAFAVSLSGSPYDLAALTAQVADDRGRPACRRRTTPARSPCATRIARADPDGAFPTGIGPMPAPAIAELRTIEALTHGWDIARGTGTSLGVDDAVAERAIAHSLALMKRLPPDRNVFGSPQPVADDAPAIDRLAALLGRDVRG